MLDNLKLHHGNLPQKRGVINGNACVFNVEMATGQTCAVV
jgi:hypothetical protein